MRSELNINHLSNLILDISLLLISKVLHSVMGFEEFTPEGSVDLLSCEYHRFNYIIARRT